MRRLITIGLAVTAVLAFAATPATASASSTPSTSTSGWIRVPQQAFDLPAGARCDSAIHVEPVVDEVRKLVLATYPDGSPKREFYTGDLIMEVTNTDTGAKTLADASGSATFVYAPDGSMTWYAVGPVLLGFRENAGSLPRGLWIVDGVYIVQFSPDLIHKTITMIHGTTHNVCTDID